MKFLIVPEKKKNLLKDPQNWSHHSRAGFTHFRWFSGANREKDFSYGGRRLKRPQIVSKDTQFDINLGIKWRGTLAGENGVGEVVWSKCDEVILGARTARQRVKGMEEAEDAGNHLKKGKRLYPQIELNSGWETWLPNGTCLALSKGGRTCPLI